MSDALGHKLRGELEAKIAKWQEPDKQKQKKALPKPEDKPKKKRAGKRVRRQKERFAETEVQKLANKRAFSEASGEYGDDAMGIDFGMLGKAGSGQLR